MKTATIVDILFINCLFFFNIQLSSSFFCSKLLFTTKTRQRTSIVPVKQQVYDNILILDHLNINHEKGRHDLLKAFYFDFLKCAIDPRKEENIIKGSKTLWANIGAHQFHLPEGKPDAQVLNGFVTLVYPNIQDLVDSYANMSEEMKKILFASGSKFSLLEMSENNKNFIQVTDPWGNIFKITEKSDEKEGKDNRGVQKGGDSLGLSMKDISFYTPTNCNLEGIARFYRDILGAPILQSNENGCIVSVGPYQTLSFVPHPEYKSIISHVDIRDEPPVDDTKPHYSSNYGPHISIYVSDIRSTYKRAQDLGVTYVNPRFKRRAYNEEEVVEDCMFRCIDIIDPENAEDGVIIQLEHEIRSVVKRDGSLYKSCPFVEIPSSCVI